MHWPTKPISDEPWAAVPTPCRLANVKVSDGYHWYDAERVVPDPRGDFLSSAVGDSLPEPGHVFPNTKGYHVPLFDLDYPLSLVESKTPGHYHLTLNRLVKWRKYKRVLRAMYRAGLIDGGWYHLAKRRNQAILRRQESPLAARLPSTVAGGTNSEGCRSA